ncbi:hypothetical protein EFY79_18475 [Hanamia caeni]|jgi:agmatine/peptidylarginine deiminase|uniref:Uncharacterized protein n=1 Tax=Hanamia caeni TaxID=2294116 RepID=A0A3M9N8F6_9BACT|nr:hypothetical protein EFY79_18475 [Hanamia caeni]
MVSIFIELNITNRRWFTERPLEIPCNTSANKNNDQANGEYLNYLQLKNVIILPAFGIPEDEIVMEQFKKLFPATGWFM